MISKIIWPKVLTHISVIALLCIFVSSGTAQLAESWEDISEEEKTEIRALMREKWENVPEEEREKMREEWELLSDEEREQRIEELRNKAIQERNERLKEQMREKWEDMDDEEQREIRRQMRAQMREERENMTEEERAQRRERWESMTDEERREYYRELTYEFMIKMEREEETPQSPAFNLREKIDLMRKEIDYLKDSYSQQNAKWSTYNKKVEDLTTSVEEALTELTEGDDTDTEKLAKLADKLEQLHRQIPIKLPSGPSGAGRFGAFYTHLKYSLEWDKPWRVGDHADVVVKFDDGGHKFVFWRGTSYIPCWVTDTDVWYTNEFVERRGHHSPNTEGCVEPMSDKQCRFSHVRIIESNDARVVVHWRYAPVDVRYEHPFTDPLTGWSDWVDEYYTIYPNAAGVRKITVHTTRPDLWTEFQEAIVVNQPGTLPDDNIELGAVSLANMKGESKTYYWTESGGPEFDAGPKLANIFKINLKGSLKPFALVTPPDKGVLITPYGGHGRKSHFNWWDHWPVAQVASDGRRATSADKPSHSSLCHIGLPGTATAKWKDYAKGEKWRTRIMLNGMTDKPAEALIPLAKSWLYPAKLKLAGGAYNSEGYDPTQMAYVIASRNRGKASELKIELAASKESPVINPALVIKGWGESDAELKLNGRKIKRGKDFRLGHRNTVEGSDLIVWIKTESTKPIKVALSPVTD